MSNSEKSMKFIQNMYVYIGPADFEANQKSVTLCATTSTTSAMLRITIVDEYIMENDEDFHIMLSTSEMRITIANSTSVIILNDDGEYSLTIVCQHQSLRGGILCLL